MEPYFRPNLWKSAFERVKRKSLYIFIISEEIIEFPIHKNGGSSILDPEECGNREKADGFCGAESIPGWDGVGEEKKSTRVKWVKIN